MSRPPFTVGWVHNLGSTSVASNGQTVITVAIVFPVISILAIVGRCKVRLELRSFGWDDLSILLSTLLGISYSAIAIYRPLDDLNNSSDPLLMCGVETRWGLGLGVADFPALNVITFSKYAGGPIYCLAVLCFKLSLLMTYIRLTGFKRVHAMIVYIVTGAVAVSQIVFACLLSFACQPISKQWNPSVPGQCINTMATYFALGATSLLGDLVIIFLPFPVLRKLQLDRKNKFALGVTFGLGFFVTVVQAVRINTIAKLSTYTQSERVIEWSIVEINLGVLVACLPTFRPLLKSSGERASHSSRPSPTVDNGYSKSGTLYAYPSEAHNVLVCDETELDEYPSAGQCSVLAHVQRHRGQRIATIKSVDDRGHVYPGTQFGHILVQKSYTVETMTQE